MSEECKCRICGAPSSGMHFGCEACRACAAFFRRTVSCHRGYICRGNSNCEISLSVRNICRSCRYKKCLRCGMLTANVQPKRDTLKNSGKGVRSEAQSPDDVEYSKKKPDSSCERIPSVSSTDAPEVRGQLILASARHMVTALSSHSIINFIRQEYNRLSETRILSEKAIIYENLHIKVKTSAMGCPEPVLLPFHYSIRLCNSGVPLLAKFVLTTFQQFREMSREQKWAIFSLFVPFMWSLECYFYTVRCFPTNAKNSLLRLSSCSYIDVDRMDEHFAASEINASVAETFKKIYIGHTKKMGIVRKLSISESEFVALIALALFFEGFDNLNRETVRVCRTMREKIFHGLHVYYTEELGIRNYAARLGETMSLLTLVWDGMLRMKSTLETAEMFGMFKMKDILFDSFPYESF